MKKKKSGSSVQCKPVAKNAQHITDNKIDYSDISESSDEELKKATRVGRPRGTNNKQLIAIRISPDVLSRLRKLAQKQDKNYQTLINEILEDISKKKAA